MKDLLVLEKKTVKIEGCSASCLSTEPLSAIVKLAQVCFKNVLILNKYIARILKILRWAVKYFENA